MDGATLLCYLSLGLGIVDERILLPLIRAIDSAALYNSRLTDVRNHGYKIRYIPENSLTRELCLEAIKTHGGSIVLIPQRHRTLELYFAAISSIADVLDSALNNYATPLICVHVIEWYGRSVRCILRECGHTEICLAAVKRYGPVLKYIPERFRILEVCTAAVKQNGLAIEFVPKNLKAEVIGQTCCR